MAKQVTIIRLDELVAREMRACVSMPNSGYSSVDEFVEVAIRNQLAMQSDDSSVMAAQLEVLTPSSSTNEMIRPLPATASFELAEPKVQAGALSALTNRLSPLKIALRVACNLAIASEWPDTKTFQEEAAKCARQVGLGLRSIEHNKGLTGAERRSTAFPCGDDKRKALDRFIAHFTTARRSGSAPGPLEILGFAVVENGKVKVTTDGWALATAPSPILGECEGWNLGDAEKNTLVKRITLTPDEAEAVCQLLRITKRAAGNQRRIDELFSLAHSEWTHTLAISHRAAIVGRSRELGFIDLEGRGTDAKLQVTSLGEDWLNERRTKEHR